MCEYNKMKAELEESKCPLHGKSAVVSFTFGKMVIENCCCEYHRQLLNENLADVAEKNLADIISEVF